MKSKPPNLERLTSAALRKLAPLRSPDEAKALDKYSHQYWIKNFQQLDLSLLTNFLLLTRLQDDQIVALANQDPRYRPYAETLGLLSSEAELARQTGLSPVSLSNFKAGGDIRLSNLLKIAKALGLCLTIKG